MKTLVARVSMLCSLVSPVLAGCSGPTAEAQIASSEAKSSAPETGASITPATTATPVEYSAWRSIACDAEFDLPLPKGSFDRFRSKVATELASPRHRGRDALITADDPQWLIAKF